MTLTTEGASEQKVPVTSDSYSTTFSSTDPPKTFPRGNSTASEGGGTYTKRLEVTVAAHDNVVAFKVARNVYDIVPAVTTWRDASGNVVRVIRASRSR